jgi:hypothetical protein
MQTWIITAGSYEDERIVGVAFSREDAEALLTQAEAHPAIRPDFDEDYTIYGPYEAGRLYDWKGEAL